MMTYQCSELGSIPLTSESLTPFRDLNRRKGIAPTPDLTELIPEASRERFSRTSEKKAKALGRALDRVAGWNLPGKDHIAEYLRDAFTLLNWS